MQNKGNSAEEIEIEDANIEQMIAGVLHGLKGKTDDEISRIVQEKTEFYKKKIEFLKKKIDEDFPHEETSDLHKLLDEERLIKFKPMTPKEKAAVVSLDVLKSYIITFVSWTIVGFVISVPGASDVLFNRATFGSTLIGSFSVAALVQSVSDSIGTISNSLFAITDALPSYIEDPVLNISLAHRTRRKRLEKAVKELKLDDDLERELIKKIGDSAYGFTSSGISKRGIKRRLVRVKDNLLNQLHARPRSTYKTMYDKLINKGHSETYAAFVARLKKVGIEIQGFIINRAFPETQQDGYAGVASNLLTCSAGLNPFIVSLVAASVAAVCTGLSQNHRLDPHKTAAVLGLQKGIPIQMAPKHTLHVEGGIKSFATTKFYKNMVIQTVLRGIGRFFFEYLIRPIIAIQISASAWIAGLYEGLRGGFGQHFMKYFGADLIAMSEQDTKYHEHQEKLYRKDLDKSTILLSLGIMRRIDEDIEKQKKVLRKCIWFTVDEIVKTDKKDPEREFKLNWLSSLLNMEQEIERVKEEREPKINKLQLRLLKQLGGPEDLEESEELEQLTAIYDFKISNLVKNAEYLTTIVEYYASIKGKEAQYHRDMESSSEISASKEIPSKEIPPKEILPKEILPEEIFSEEIPSPETSKISKDSGFVSSDSRPEESHKKSEKSNPFDELSPIIDDEKNYTDDEKYNIFYNDDGKRMFDIDNLFFIDDEKNYTDDEKYNIFYNDDGKRMFDIDNLEPNVKNSSLLYEQPFENEWLLLKKEVALLYEKAKMETEKLSTISNKKPVDVNSKKSPLHRGIRSPLKLIHKEFLRGVVGRTRS